MISRYEFSEGVKHAADQLIFFLLLLQTVFEEDFRVMNIMSDV